MKVSSEKLQALQALADEAAVHDAALLAQLARDSSTASLSGTERPHVRALAKALHELDRDERLDVVALVHLGQDGRSFTDLRLAAIGAWQDAEQQVAGILRRPRLGFHLRQGIELAGRGL